MVVTGGWFIIVLPHYFYLKYDEYFFKLLRLGFGVGGEVGGGM